MSGVSSKRVKGKGKVSSKRQRTTLSSSEPPIHLTRKECEEKGLPLPRPHYGLDLRVVKPSISFTGAHLERYKAISTLKAFPLRYFDSYAMEKLGIFDEVKDILDKCGWPSWMHMDEPTCSDLVYEFFVTVDFKYKLFEGNKTDYRLIFRMMGKWFDVRLEEICDWFGWEYNVGARKPPVRFAAPFWQELSSGPCWTASRAKSTHIKMPKFSYIHRVMSHSLFGNAGSNSAVSVQELSILYWMHEKQQIDWGYFFFKRLVELSRRKEKGSFIIGGFLTRIAIRLGILDRDRSPISWMEGRDPVATVDFNELKNMHVIEGDYHDFRWTGFGKQSRRDFDCVASGDMPISEPVRMLLYGDGSGSPVPDDDTSSHSHRAYLDEQLASLRSYFDEQLATQRTFIDEHMASHRAYLDEHFNSVMEAQRSQRQWIEQSLGPVMTYFQRQGFGLPPSSSLPSQPSNPSDHVDDA